MKKEFIQLLKLSVQLSNILNKLCWENNTYFVRIDIKI